MYFIVQGMDEKSPSLYHIEHESLFWCPSRIHNFMCRRAFLNAIYEQKAQNPKTLENTPINISTF